MGTDDGPGAPWPSTETLPARSLVRVMAWLSPSFPVGAFAWSSGLEWAVEAGDVRDAESLRGWLAVLLERGSLFCDAALFAHAYHAAARADHARLSEVAELALALAPSRERFDETRQQGNAFLMAVTAAWPCEALAHPPRSPSGDIAYPVAVALAAAAHGIAFTPCVVAFIHALVANMISAGVRLVPLGQTDGLRVLAALEPAMEATAARVADVPLDAIGSSSFRADLASMHHETQYTRLFRS